MVCSSAYYPGEEMVEEIIHDAKRNDCIIDEIRLFDANNGVYEKGRF